MNETIVVRPCTEADLPLLRRRVVRQGSDFAASALRLAQAGDYFFVGAFTDDDVAGYVALDCRAETELRPEMKSLWVYPEYRRRGLGVQLTRAVEKIAAEQGFDEVTLGVDPENPAAIPLYISLDYTPTGHHRTTADGEGGEQVEAIYRKSLALLR